MLNNYAFCQTERYIPEDMDLIDGATVLLSLHHKIPMSAVYESMRKYKKHQDEVNSGMFGSYIDYNNLKTLKTFILVLQTRTKQNT